MDQVTLLTQMADTVLGSSLTDDYIKKGAVTSLALQIMLRNFELRSLDLRNLKDLSELILFSQRVTLQLLLSQIRNSLSAMPQVDTNARRFTLHNFIYNCVNYIKNLIAKFAGSVVTQVMNIMKLWIN